MSGHSAEKDAPRATIEEALAAWEAKGPTSLTVALVVDALYGVREQVEALCGWGVGRDTNGVDRLVPASELRALLTSVTSPAEGRDS